MLRKILGAIAGVVISVVVIKLMEMIGHQLFPIPGEIDVSDPDSIATYMDQIPLGSKISVVVSWTLGSLIGGVAGGRIAGARWASWPPGAFTMFGLVMIAMMIPHPIWMLVSGAVGIAGGTFIADRLSAPSTVRETGNG